MHASFLALLLLLVASGAPVAPVTVVLFLYGGAVFFYSISPWFPGTPPNKNHTPGYWMYAGTFSVELTEDAGLSFVPRVAGIVVEGRVIHIKRGRVTVGMGVAQMYLEGQPFCCLGRHFVREIRNGRGEFLWHNRRYT